MKNELIETRPNSQYLLENDHYRISNFKTTNNQKTLNNNPQNLNKNFTSVDNIDKNKNIERQDQIEEDTIYFNLYFFIRSFLVILGVALISLNTVYGFALPHTDIKCLDDKLFTATESVNKYFSDNVTARHILLILSSLCVDISVIYMFAIWCLYGKSWRILISLFGFYTFRGIIQVN